MTLDTELLRPGETLDDLQISGMRLIQSAHGYRFSLDAVLLAHFPDLTDVKRVIDLGTGNGIIPCLLASRAPNLQILGVERQEEMVDRARRSVVINGLESRITILPADIRTIEKHLPRGEAELVLSNPPFWREGEGLISRHPEAAAARHELHLKLAELIEKSAYLLAPRGRLAIIHRAQRLAEVLELFTRQQIFPRRLRLVHPRADREANLMMLEGVKNRRGQLHILPPLAVYSSPGEYSQEIKQIYRSEE